MNIQIKNVHDEICASNDKSIDIEDVFDSLATENDC